MAKKHAFQANSLISFPQIGRVSIYLFIIQGLRHSDCDQEKCNYNECMCYFYIVIFLTSCWRWQNTNLEHKQTPEGHQGSAQEFYNHPGGSMRCSQEEIESGHQEAALEVAYT